MIDKSGRLLLLVLVAFFGGYSQAFGDVSVTHQDLSKYEHIAQEISAKTMSPYCPGRTIAACPSSKARDLRAEIVKWLAEGMTEEGVRNRLVISYGEEITGTPAAEGIGLVAWFVPIIFSLLLSAVIVILLRGLKAGKAASEDKKTNTIDPQLALRVSEELKERMS